MVRAFPERTFHNLVTLSHLAAWGLGLVPTAEKLGHEETTHRSKYRLLHFISTSLFFFFFFLIDFPRHRDNYNEGEQRENSDQWGRGCCSTPIGPSGFRPGWEEKV